MSTETRYAKTRSSVDRSRRILLISNIYPPAIGGPATFISHLAKSLAQRGDRVTVVCSTDSSQSANQIDPPDLAVTPGVVTHRYSIENRYRYELAIRARLLRELVRHEQVLVNGLESYVTPISKLLGKRYILKIVGDSVWERARNLGATSLDFDTFQREMPSRWVAARTAHVETLLHAQVLVTPSEYLRDIVVGWGLAPHTVQVIPNAASPLILGCASSPSASSPSASSPEVRSPASYERALHEPIRLLFVGRLTNWKGVETILLALTRLPTYVSLSLYGDGPELPLLEALARQLNIYSRCTFFGRAQHSAVISAMTHHHALILPSLYEGMSHTVLDALASGLPVIASACGGNEELLGGERTSDASRMDICGIMVPPQNPDALADAITRLTLANVQVWQQLSNAARRRAQIFSQDNMISRYLKLLDSSQQGG